MGIPHAIEQRLACQIVRLDPAQGVQAAREDVIDTAVGRRLLEVDQVLGLLNDKDGGGVAIGRGADTARIDVGEVEADGAVPHMLFDVGNRLAEVQRVFGHCLEDVERHPLGAAAADTGQLGELVDQAFHGIGP